MFFQVVNYHDIENELNKNMGGRIVNIMD